MENKFKANREFIARSTWSDWREQLKDSEINGLLQRLETMEREVLVDWLQWYNPKGNYTDRKCMENGIKPLCKSKAIEYTYKEILRNHAKKQYNSFSNGPLQLMFNN
ncbi:MULTISPECIES: hypothetical protein [unclassified Sphingobacterium]|uniref:hypothetical protein n=1 Tax=unclassified Sphingobacterium TaxID=2609468 RepID=UPI0025F207BD|nr:MULTISPECIES: hypothetical protein [unclassified Sphingobacterium]